MELTPNGMAIFNDRYAMRNEQREITETPTEAVSRISNCAAQAEKPEEREQWASQFAEIIDRRDFVPSTPIWANMGKPDRPWQPGACFVLDVEDSLDSMYQTLKDSALVCKSGGGLGYNFSKIRPKGDLVRSTKGQASGVVELIRLYDSSAGMIKQGGVRRGAFMGILNCDHPEVRDFIRVKREGGIENFNLSVGVTDKFMQAVQNDELWEFRFNGEVRETLPARQLWNEIMEAAWACGDPGVIFLDRLTETNPVPVNQINATNPCVTADTWVFTANGPRQVKDLIGGRFTTVVNGKLFPTGEKGFFKTATKAVVRLRTQEGYTLRLTTDHKILRVANKTRYRIEREWVPAGELKPGDQIILHNHRELKEWPGRLNEGEGYLLGLLIGDGTLKKETAVLSVWSQEKAVNQADGGDGTKLVMEQAWQYARTLLHRSDFAGWTAVKDRHEFRLKQASIKILANKMGLSPGNKTITPQIEEMSSAAYRGFLRGLFDADGTVLGTQQKGVSVRLAQSNLALLQAVQRMLLRLGIVSRIYPNRRPAGEKMLPDSRRLLKKYSVQAQHELAISKDNLFFFAERVGFTNRDKAIKLETLLKSYQREFNRERFTATVLDITEDGVEDVYDVQVPGVNAFDANGLYAHNCGEQPLSPGESCLLGSINLANMVENGEVNWDKLKQVTAVAVRFLDNMIDVAEYPLDFIAHHTRNTRKIGLGILGLHDLLIKCSQAYDSPEGRQLASQVMRYIQEEAHRTSASLGEEKSVFPQWEQSVFAATGECRRNAACITIAPTGSITVLAGAEGYGIEPIFAVAYRKTTQAGVFDVFSPLFQEACEKAGVSPRAMTAVAKKGSCQGIEGIPERIRHLFKGAQDIDPKDHLAMQIALQQYVDNAISKTINLPNSATAEDIGEIYLAAWAGGLKGITVFRDGSKQGVIEVGEQKSKEVKNLGYGQIKPRPTRTLGVTERLDTGCGKVYLTVNYDPDTGEVIETFITTGSDGGCLVYTEATSRLVSMAIRAGVPIPEIVEQLQSTHSCPSWMLAKGKGRQLSPGKSCASSIGAALEKTIRENGFKMKVSGEIEAPSGVICPECNKVLMPLEGCYTCQNCGYSRC